MLRWEKVLEQVEEAKKCSNRLCESAKRPQRARKKERASDVVNGCKLIAVMWILIPINQGQCGLWCHLFMAGQRHKGALI